MGQYSIPRLSPTREMTPLAHSHEVEKKKPADGLSAGAAGTAETNVASLKTRPRHAEGNSALIRKAFVNLNPVDLNGSADRVIRDSAMLGKEVLTRNMALLLAKRGEICIDLNGLDSRLAHNVLSALKKSAKANKDNPASMKNLVLDLASFSERGVKIADMDDCIDYLGRYGVKVELLNSELAKKRQDLSPGTGYLHTDPLFALCGRETVHSGTLQMIHSMTSQEFHLLSLGNPKMPEKIRQAAEQDILQKIDSSTLTKADDMTCKSLAMNRNTELTTLKAIRELDNKAFNTRLADNPTYRKAHLFDVLKILSGEASSSSGAGSSVAGSFARGTQDSQPDEETVSLR